MHVKTLFAFQYIFNNLFEQFSIKRFGYFNLDPNYTALLFLMIAHFLSNNFRNKKIVFFLLSFVILFLTRSKCGLVYLLIYFFSNYIKNLFSNYNFLFSFYIFIIISISLSSLIFISIVPTPNYGYPPSKEKEEAFIKWRAKNYKYFQDIIICKSDKDTPYEKEIFKITSDDNNKFFSEYNNKLNLLKKKNDSLNKSSEMQSISGEPKMQSIYDELNKYECIGKTKRNHLFHIFNHSNYHRFFTYGVSTKEIFTNVRYFISMNPILQIKKTNK